MTTVKFLIYGSIVLSLLFGCSRAPTAGGSSDSGNVKFAGIIYSVADSTVSGATVTLCPANSLGGVAEETENMDSSIIKRTITDDSGRFEFTSLQEGSYFIEANDGIAHAVLFRLTVSQQPETILFHQDTLRPYSVFKGTTTRSTSERYLFIYGIDRKVPVPSDGHFIVHDMPAGTFRAKIIPVDTTEDEIEISDFTLTAGDTSMVPLTGWKFHRRMYLNTTATGADIAGNVTDFPVLVRLSNENFDFSETDSNGYDCRFTSNDNQLIPFSVERWNPQLQHAEIWVKIDTIFGNSDSQYFTMYWGKPGAATAENSPAVFDTASGFQGVWHFSDNEPASALDATGNHFNGTAEGGVIPAITGGCIGNARKFNGISSSIEISNSAGGKLNFPENGVYSISAWVYADHPELGSQVIVSKGDEQYFLCSVDGSATSGPFWRFTEFRNSKGWVYSSGDATGKEWVYLCGVQNGSSRYLYINGELADSTSSLLSSGKSRRNDFNVAIGKFIEEGGGNGDDFFNGLIDEVRIYSTVSDPERVRLCYMNQCTDDRLLTFSETAQ